MSINPYKNYSKNPYKYLKESFNRQLGIIAPSAPIKEAVTQADRGEAEREVESAKAELESILEPMRNLFRDKYRTLFNDTDVEFEPSDPETWPAKVLSDPEIKRTIGKAKSAKEKVKSAEAVLKDIKDELIKQSASYTPKPTSNDDSLSLLRRGEEYEDVDTFEGDDEMHAEVVIGGKTVFIKERKYKISTGKKDDDGAVKLDKDTAKKVKSHEEKSGKKVNLGQDPFVRKTDDEEKGKPGKIEFFIREVHIPGEGHVKNFLGKRRNTWKYATSMTTKKKTNPTSGEVETVTVPAYGEAAQEREMKPFDPSNTKTSATNNPLSFTMRALGIDAEDAMNLISVHGSLSAFSRAESEEFDTEDNELLLTGIPGFPSIKIKGTDDPKGFVIKVGNEPEDVISASDLIQQVTALGRQSELFRTFPQLSNRDIKPKK